MNTTLLGRFRILLTAMAAVLLASPTAFGQSQWNLPAGGVWNNAANWLPTTVPGAVAGDVANLDLGALTNNATITLDNGTTAYNPILGALNASDPNFNYSVATGLGGFLTFNNGALAAQVNLAGNGALTISANMTIANATGLTVSNTSTGVGANGALTFGGTVSGVGGINVTAGTMTLANTVSNTYTGGTTIGSGATLAASAATGLNPFGTGAINLAGGTLSLTPTASTSLGGLTARLITNADARGDTARLDFTQTANSSAVFANLNLPTGPFNANTGYQFVGKLQIVTGGSYTFQIGSDDGSRLFVDGVLVVQNDGSKGVLNGTSTALNLSSGLHDIRIDYTNGTGGSGMTFFYAGPDPGATQVAVPTTRLFQPETTSLGGGSSNAINLGNALNVSGASTIALQGGAFTQVRFGAATFAAGSGLTLTTNAGQTGKGLRIGGATTFGSGVTLGLVGDGANGANLNFDGAISDGGVATTITKTGLGRLQFNNSSSVNAMLSASILDITAGTLVLNGSSAAGSFNPIGAATINLSGGTLVLDSKVGNTNAYTEYANAITLGTAATIQSIVSGGSPVRIGNGTTLNVNNTLTLDAIRGGNPTASLGAVLVMGADLTGSAGINLVSTGIGTLSITPVNGVVAFSGNNTGYTGTISLGALTSIQFLNPNSIGGATVAIPAGTTLNLAPDGDGTGRFETVAFTAPNLTFTGNMTVTVGRNGYGPNFLTALNKTVQLSPVVLTGTSLTVTNANQYGLDLSGTTTLPAAYTLSVGTASPSSLVPGLTLSGVVGGAGFTKTGVGTVLLTNAGNTFTGNMTANSGFVASSSDAALGDPANTVILNANTTSGTLAAMVTTAGSTSVTGTSTAGFLVGQPITGTNIPANTIVVAVNSGTQLTLSNAATASGTALTGTGQTLTGFAAFGTYSSGRTFTFSNANAGANIINVSAGNTFSITSALTGANGFQKSESGTLLLGNAASTLTGAVIVNGGALQITNAAALGTASSVTVIQIEGTAFQLSGGITFARPITLNGSTGIQNNGQLENFAGSNTVSSAITLAGASTIGNSAAGTTFNLTGGLSGAFGLTLNGPGATNIGTTALGAVTGLTRNGAGSTNLTVASPLFVSAIAVNTGTLTLSGAGTVGVAAVATTIGSGGTIRIDNTGTVTSNRFGGATTPRTMNLTNGTFFYSAGATAQTESTGAFTSTWGNNVIRVDAGAGTSAITFASMAANAINGGSTLVFQSGPAGAGAVFGSTLNQVFFTTAPTLTPATSGILQRGVVWDSTAGGFNFASYNHNGTAGNALGIQAFTGGNITNNLVTAAATDTMRLSASANAPTRTLNALLSSGTNTIDGLTGVSTVTLTAASVLVQSGTFTQGVGIVLAGAGIEVNLFPATGATFAVNGPITNSTNVTKGLGGTVNFNTRQFFNTGANYLTINDGTVNLNAGDNTLWAGSVPAGQLQNLSVNGSGVLNLNGTVQQVGAFQNANNNNVFGNGGSVTSTTAAVLSTRNGNSNWSGVISGPVTFAMANVTAGNVERFYNDNTYTGRTGIMGGTLEVMDLGRLSGTTAIDIAYGTLSIQNNSGNNGRFNLTDRIPDGAAINSRGGFLTFTGRAQTNSTESVGVVSLLQGATNLTSNTGGTGINSAVLTLADLLQTNRDAVVNLNGAGGQLGNASRLLITTRETTPGLVNNLVGGWAVNSGNEFLSYIPTLGLAALNANGYAGYNSTVFPVVSDPTSNIRITVAAALPAGGMNINALSYQNAAAATLSFTNATDTLNLTSGGLVKGTAFVLTIGSVANEGRLTAGGPTPVAGTQYLYLHNTAAVANNITMNSRIIDNGGNAVRLVFTGFNGGALVLNGTNSYSGGTAVNGWNGSTLLGTLTVGATGTLPAGDVTLNNAILTQVVGGVIMSTNSVNLNGSSSMTLVGNNALVNLNFDNNGGNATGTVTTGGVLSLTGTITAASSNVSTLPVINGTIDFGGGTKTFTISPIQYNGSTLTALQPTLSIAGVIQNAGTISVTGGGRLQLGGQNTFTGGVVVDGASGIVLGASGTLTAGPLGTGTLVAQSGATFLSTAAVGVANPVTVLGNLNFDGLTNIAFGGAVALPAATTINVAAPQQTVALGGSIPGTPVITKTGPGTLLLPSNFSGTLNGVTGSASFGIADDLDGTGNPLTAVVPGSFNSTGGVNFVVGRNGFSYAPYFPSASNKTFSASVTWTGGIVLTNNNGYGLNVTNAVVHGAADAIYNVVNATNSNLVQGLTVSGALSGVGGILKSGAGALELTNASNTFGGAGKLIDITGGIVAVSSDGALGDAANGVRFNIAGTTGVGFRATGTFGTSRAFTLNQATNAIEVIAGNTLTMNTAFTIPTGTNQLVKNDNGTLELAVANPGTWTGSSITAAGASVQTLTGGILVNAGILRVSNAAALGGAANIIAVNNGGVVAGSGAAVQISGGITVPNPLVLNTQTGNGYTGGINWSGALHSIGNGVTNTWSGAISENQDSGITADAGNTLNLTGGINQNAHITVYGGAGTINITTNPILAVHSLDKIGSGLVNIQVATAAPTGSGIRVYAGELRFSGAAGAVSGAGTIATILLPGGTLGLDSSGSAVSNRLGGRAFTFIGGNLNLNGNAGTAVTEAIGAPAFNRGQTTITITDGGAGTNLTFTANSNNVNPAQSTGGSGATLLVRGTSLGNAAGAGVATFSGGTGALLFNGASTGATGTTSKAIFPWMVVDTSVTGLGFSFGTADAAAAAVNSTAIVRPLTAAEYSNTTSLVAGTNALVNTTSGAISNQAVVTVNSITMDNNTGITMGTFQNLTISSGGLLVRDNQTSSVIGGIMVAPAGNSAWNIHVIGTQNVNRGVLNLASNMSGGNGAASIGLVKAGGGTLNLNTTLSTIPGLTAMSSNTLTMQTVVNQGRIVLGGGTNTLGAANYLEVGAGGILDLGGTSQYVRALFTDGYYNGINGVTAGGTVTSTGGNGTLVVFGDTAASASGGPAGRNWAGAVTGSVYFNRTGTTDTGTPANNPMTIYQAQTYTLGTLLNGGLTTLRDNGAFSNTSSIDLNYAALQLDNTGSTNLSGRLGAAPITMRGGILVYLGRQATASAESIGAISLAEGWNVINPRTAGTGINSAVLTAASLTRPAGSTAVVQLNRADGTNDFNGQIGSTGRFVLTAAPTLSQNIIGPWAVSTREWASYIPGFGVGQLNANGFAGYATTTFLNAAATDNVRATATTPVLTANTTVNSFNLLTANVAATVDLGGFRLTLTGGGLLNGTGGNTQTFQNGTLTSGYANGTVNDLYFHHLPYAGTSRFGVLANNLGVVDNSGTPVRFVISNSDIATASLSVASGPVTTNAVLFNSTSSTYTGGTVINQGVVVVANGGVLPAGGVTLNSATLAQSMANAIGITPGTYASGNVFTLNGPSNLLFANNATIAGLVINNTGAAAAGAGVNTATQAPTVSTFQAGLGTDGRGTLTLGASGLTAISNNVATTSIIVGRLDIGSGTQTFNIGANLVNGVNVAPLQPTLALQGVLGSAVINKTGDGVLQFNGQAINTGTINVLAGGIGFNTLTDNGLNPSNEPGPRFATINLSANTFINMSNTDATLGGLAGSGSVINSTRLGGTFSPRTLNFGVNNASTTFSGQFARFSDASLFSNQFNKLGSGTFTFTGTGNTLGVSATAGMQVSQGTWLYSGAGNTAFSNHIVIPTGSLVLDNSGGNVNNRLGGGIQLGTTATATILALSGGNFTIIGNADAATSETIGNFTLNNSTNAYGPAVVTFQANTAQPLTFTANAWGGLSQGTALFRGLAATAGNGNANFQIVTAGNVQVALGGTAGTGLNGSVTMPVRADILGDLSATGTGTGFLTKDSTTNFLRPITAAEMAPASAFATGTAATTTNFGFATTATTFGNSSLGTLALQAGAGLDAVSALRPTGVQEGLPITQTITGGGILSVGGSTTLNVNRLTTAATLYLHTVGNLNLTGTITGPTGISKAGAGTLTLNTRLLTGGVFHVNDGAVILNAGPNTLRGDITAGAPANLNALALNTPTASVDLNGSNLNVGSLFGNNSVQRYAGGLGTITNTSATPAILNANMGGAHTFGGVIAGNLSFNKGGNNALTLTNANTFSGVTNVRANTLTLLDAGTLANTTAINVNYAALAVDQSGLNPVSNLNPQRFNAAAPVTLRGGSFALTAGGSSDSTQTINTLNASQGANTITANTAPISGYGLISIGNLVVDPDSTVNFVGNGGFLNVAIGLNASQIQIGQINGVAIPSAITGRALGGNMIVSNGEFATYFQAASTGSNNMHIGVATMNGNTGPLGTLATGYDSGGAALTFIAGGATVSMRLANTATGTTINLPAGGVIYNVLAFRGAGTTTMGFVAATDVLNIVSGGLALTQNTPILGTAALPGVLTAGGAAPTGTVRLYVHSSGSTINSVIANNGASPLRLVVNAIGGTTTIAGANTYIGGFVANGTGTVAFTNVAAGSAVPAGTVTLNGATVTVAAANNQIHTAADVTVNAGVLTFGTAAGTFTNTVNSITFTNTGGTAAPTVNALGAAGASLTLAATNAITAVNDNITTVPLIAGTAATSVLNFTATNPVITTSTTQGVPTGLNMTINIASAPGGLVKEGTGSLALSQANTFTTGVLLNTGGIILGNNAALGTGTLTMAANTALVSDGTLRTITNPLTLTGDVTFGSHAAFANATSVAGNGFTQNTGAIDIGAGTTRVINVNGPTTVATLNGIVNATTSGLTKDGVGTLALGGVNNFSGVVTINAGTLAATAAGALGTGAGAGNIVFNGGILQHGGTNTTDYSSRFSTAANQRFYIDTVANNVTYATALTTSGTDSTLTKLGSGNLTITADGTAYDGPTIIVAGTLQVGGIPGGTVPGATGLIPANNPVLNSGTLRWQKTTNDTLNGVISGSGQITKFGLGDLRLTGVNTFTGNVTLNNATPARGGSITITNSSSLGVAPLGGTKTITIISNFATSDGTLFLDPNGGPDIDLPANIAFTTSSAVGLGGITNLTGNNTIRGNFTLTGGGGSTQLTANGGTLTMAAGATYTPNQTGRFLILNGTTTGNLNGILQDSGANIPGLTKLGANTWFVTGANTYTGVTTATAGNLNVATLSNGATTSSIGASTAAAGNLVLNGGALQYTGATAQSTDRLFTVSTNGPLTNSGTLDASGTGTGTVTFSNVGTVALGAYSLAQTAPTLTTGDTTITVTNGASYLVGQAITGNGIPAGTTITSIAGNVLTISNAITATNPNVVVTGTGGGTRTLNFAGTNTGANTFNPMLDNSTAAGATIPTVLSVNKTGAGNWTLTAASTYTGPTTVSGGTLRLTGTASHAASTLVTVGTAAGSTAILNVTGLTAGSANLVGSDYTLASGQTLAGHGTVNAAGVGVTGVSSPTGTTVAPGTTDAGTLAILGNATLTATYAWDSAVAGNGSLFPTPIGNGGSSPALPHNNHDVLTVSGTTNVAGLTFNITSLGTTGFDPNNFYSWTALTSTGALTGTPLLGSVSGTDFVNGQSLGTFSITTDTNNVYVNFAPAPEPALLGLAAFGVLALVRRRTAKA